MAIGFVLFNEYGAPLAEVSEPAGIGTSCIAEYYALCCGMFTALSMGITHLEAHCDSQLVVEQYHGRYAVKREHFMPYYNYIQQLARRFTYFHLRWVPREQNWEADSLVRRCP